MTKRHEVSKYTDKLAQGRVATDVQFVKNTISVRCRKAKHNKMWHAYINCYIKVPHMKWFKTHTFIIFCGSES